MRYLDHDMDNVFFSDFALRFLRVRAGVDSLEVSGNLGIEDVDALDDHAVAARRTLLLPAGVDLRADDHLQALDADAGQQLRVGDRFRVLDVPRRVNDGAEMEALLGKA